MNLFYDKAVEKVLHYALAHATDGTHLKALAENSNYRLKLALAVQLAQARMQPDETLKKTHIMNVR